MRDDWPSDDAPQFPASAMYAGVLWIVLGAGYFIAGLVLILLGLLLMGFLAAMGARPEAYSIVIAIAVCIQVGWLVVLVMGIRVVSGSTRDLRVSCGLSGATSLIYMLLGGYVFLLGMQHHAGKWPQIFGVLIGLVGLSLLLPTVCGLISWRRCLAWYGSES